jgi:hypothetical protein
MVERFHNPGTSGGQDPQILFLNQIVIFSIPAILIGGLCHAILSILFVPSGKNNEFIYTVCITPEGQSKSRLSGKAHSG